MNVDSPPSELHASLKDSIELNNGAKWKVVPEMLLHIRNMESAINRIDKVENRSFEEFQKLGESLKGNIDLLTSNCTMEGKAHDELHKWLLPYIDLVDALNNSKSMEESMQIIEEIRSSFNRFNTFFELKF